MEDPAEEFSSCSLNSQETVVPEQTDFDPFGGLLLEPNEQPKWDVIEASGKVLSTPELASNSLWSQSNSRKRGLSAGGLPLVDGKKPRKYDTFRKPSPGTSFSGQQMVSLPPPSIAPVSMDGSLTVKIKFSEAKVFVKRVISYDSANFAKIQEMAEECLSVERGTYDLCYVEAGGDLIRLASQVEMQDALSQINNHEIKILADRS